MSKKRTIQRSISKKRRTTHVDRDIPQVAEPTQATIQIDEVVKLVPEVTLSTAFVYDLREALLAEKYRALTQGEVLFARDTLQGVLESAARQALQIKNDRT